MDPFTLVKKDYELVKTMLSELELTTERGENKRREMFDTLKRALSGHDRSEDEGLVSPAHSRAMARSEETDVVFESYMEHRIP